MSNRIRQQFGTRSDWGRQPSWRVLGALLGLLFLYMATVAVRTPALTMLANGLGPIWLGCVLLWSAYRLVRRCPEAMWTPYFWFLAGSAIFFAAGPLIYVLGSSRVVAYVQSFIPVTAHELLLTNLLDVVGIISVLFGFSLARPFARGPVRRVAVRTGMSHASTKHVAITFLIIGGILQYLVILPFQFGEYDVVLPGIIKNLGDVYVLGLMALAYFATARRNRGWRALLYTLWAAQLAVSILTFSKHQVLLTLLLPVLGSYLGHQRHRKLAVWAVVAVALYLSLGTFVLYGREQIYAQTGSIDQAPLSVRARIARTWFTRGMPAPRAGSSATGVGWARLAYTGPQAFAMSRYDHGHEGDTLRYLPIALIPRVLWPDKPVTTAMAVDFYQLVTGRRGSHLGLGVFGEGYWDYGWVGVVLLSMLAGAFMALISECALCWVRYRALEYLPSIFLGINMGLVGMTQFFVTSVFTPIAFFAIYAIVVWAIVQMSHAMHHTNAMTAYRA